MSSGAAVTDSASALSLARSFLFVPANRPDRYAKALASGAGAVIVDLEDAVASADKLAARIQLVAEFGKLSLADRSRLALRINAAGTPWHEDDLLLLSQLAQAGLAGVVLPKVESVAAVERVAAHIGQSCALLPMLESAAGLAQLDLVAARAGVTRLVFGNLDFQADLGMACGPDEAELQPVRLALVLASRRAGLPAPVDGVTPTTGRVDGGAQLQLDAQRSRRSGFGAKLCIHPDQVATVNAALGPTSAEVDWASRVLDHSARTGEGVFVLDGRMVDAPVLLLARRVLAQSAG